MASGSINNCLANPGYTGVGGATPVTECPAAHWKSQVGSAACVICAANTYKGDIAQTSNTCTGCPANQWSLEGSLELANCTCNAGYVGTGGASPCSACVPGKFKVPVGDTPVRPSLCTSHAQKEILTVSLSCIFNCLLCSASTALRTSSTRSPRRHQTHVWHVQTTHRALRDQGQPQVACAMQGTQALMAVRHHHALWASGNQRSVLVSAQIAWRTSTSQRKRTRQTIA